MRHEETSGECENNMKKIFDTNEVAVASDRLYRSVRKVIQEAQGVVSRVANWAMVEANWRVGFLIVEDEQKGLRKAEYGKAVLKDLALRLTAEYGSGYDERLSYKSVWDQPGKNLYGRKSDDYC